MVLRDDRHQRAPQVCGDIPLGAARRDGVPEHLSAFLLGPMGALVVPASFDLAQRRQELRSRDLANPPATDSSEFLLEQPLRFLLGDPRRGLGPVRQPLAPDRLEGFRRRRALGVALDAGVHAIGQEPPSLVAFLSGTLQ